MESELRSALIEWLRVDPVLAGMLNAVVEEAPSRASPPWLGIAASASADWSTKDRKGREVRVALELQGRGDDPASAAEAVRAIEARVEALPRAQDGFAVANATFLRAVLLEYRFRVLAE